MQLGLDPERLAYGLRTAAGAMIAFLLAWGIGLDHPQWAGMTVWAASQPVRAHLLEKSLFRALGTLVGAAFGALLAVLAARTGGPPVLVAGVALWLGLCAGAGNLLRGFSSYGALLAGYSAAMVALLDSGRPEHAWTLGLDRAATMLVGVAIALAVGLIFAPRRAEAEIPRRLRLASAGVLDAVAAALGGAGDPEARRRLLVEIAHIEDAVDAEGAGSLAARREARNQRRMLVAQVEALLRLETPPAPDPGLAAAVAEAARAFAAHAPAAERRVLVARLARAAREPGLRRALTGIGAAIPRPRGAPPEAPPRRLRLHRDWIAAREAAVRAAATVALIGAAWLATGWSGGPYMMLGAAIMTSVFSTFENPLALLPKAAMGQAMGVAAALACRWLVWPHLEGEGQLVLAVLPFVLLGGILAGAPRLQVQSYDYNMVTFLLLQPAWPPAGSLGDSLMIGAAVIAGPLAGWLAFRFIHPPGAARRRDALLRGLAAEVAVRRGRWRARLPHRLLRLLRWGDRAGAGPETAAAGLALYRLGIALDRVEARLAAPDLPDSARRRLRLALRRAADAAQAPERAADALAAAARLGGRDAAVLEAAAEALRANAALLAPATRPGRAAAG